MKRALALVLTLVAVALVWAMRAQLEAPDPTPAVDIGAAPSALAGLEREGPGAVPTLPELESLSDTVERPLFRPDRRPAPAGQAAAPTTATSATPPRKILTGVVIVADEPVALLRGDDPSQTQRARVGDRVDGWEVVSIEPETLVLSQGSDTYRLVLRRFDLPPPPLPGRRERARATPESKELEDPDGEDPAAAQRPRRPLQGPRRAARERLERRRAQREATN